MVRTEHDIVFQVQAAKTDPAAADGLIRQYLGFIRSETVKFLHTIPENGHEDELSIAMLAFYEAILAYERTAGPSSPTPLGPSGTGLSTITVQRSAMGRWFLSTPPWVEKRTARNC